MKCSKIKHAINRPFFINHLVLLFIIFFIRHSKDKNSGFQIRSSHSFTLTSCLILLISTQPRYSRIVVLDSMFSVALFIFNDKISTTPSLEKPKRLPLVFYSGIINIFCDVIILPDLVICILESSAFWIRVYTSSLNV